VYAHLVRISVGGARLIIGKTIVLWIFRHCIDVSGCGGCSTFHTFWLKTFNVSSKFVSFFHIVCLFKLLKYPLISGIGLISGKVIDKNEIASKITRRKIQIRVVNARDIM